MMAMHNVRIELTRGERRISVPISLQFDYETGRVTDDSRERTALAWTALTDAIAFSILDVERAPESHPFEPTTLRRNPPADAEDPRVSGNPPAY